MNFIRCLFGFAIAHSCKKERKRWHYFRGFGGASYRAFFVNCHPYLNDVVTFLAWLAAIWIGLVALFLGLEFLQEALNG